MGYGVNKLLETVRGNGWKSDLTALLHLHVRVCCLLWRKTTTKLPQSLRLAARWAWISARALSSCKVAPSSSKVGDWCIWLQHNEKAQTLSWITFKFSLTFTVLPTSCFTRFKRKLYSAAGASSVDQEVIELLKVAGSICEEEVAVRLESYSER